MISELIKSIAYFVGAFIFFWTGELILFFITFGRHNIKKTIKSGRGAKGQLYFEVSFYIGIVFWILGIIAANRYLLK